MDESEESLLPDEDPVPSSDPSRTSPGAEFLLRDAGRIRSRRLPQKFLALRFTATVDGETSKALGDGFGMMSRPLRMGLDE